MVQTIHYDDTSLAQWISAGEFDGYKESARAAKAMLDKGTGLGNDFLGWHKLPRTIDHAGVSEIIEKAAELRSKADILICIGIGGSYLGAKAAIEFLSPTFDDMRSPRILFAGHQISSDYLSDLLMLIENKSVAVNVISKSGTTTEPGIAFRLIRQWMEKRYGKAEASSRIVATTDPHNGALRKLAREENYATFDIPENIGGRFSVLTPVGLFPIAVAGIDIKKLIAGAATACDFYSNDNIADNPAACYAINRNLLFRCGKTTEVMASFSPYCHFMGEWWKQLAGESEGKNNTGIFPASVDYTTDLHSMGQWMQEGVRNVFETFIVVKNARNTLTVPKFDDDSDGLNYLADRSFEAINESAYHGTLLAHLDGNVPASTISIDDRSEESLGQAFYFFEKAIAISGYLLRVNPFDQPGVEAYKKNMFALLSKPGFEKQGEILKNKLAKAGIVLRSTT
jgi:glucose-6-phosphate isomerase